MTYLQHPLSAAFPAMSAEEFQSLKDSIEIIGVQNAITLYEGMVLDGWHRYRASSELGMPCPEAELAAGIDPVDFVKAQNKERRHLSVGAWALIEAELWDWRPAGRPSAEKGAPGAPFPPTVVERAESVGASVRTIQQAGKVKRDVIPEIKDAVKSDQVSLKDAHAIASLPKDEQAALAAAGPVAIKEAARASTQGKSKGSAKEARREALDEAMKLPQSHLCTASRLLLSAIDDLGEAGPNEAEHSYLVQVIAKCRKLVEDDTDTQLQALQFENDRLERENQELRTAAAPNVVNKLRALQEKLRTIEITRNDLMQTNSRLNDENRRLKRQINGGKARG